MYIKKAGTVLLAISVIIWASMTFPRLPEEKAAPYLQKIEQLKAEKEKLPSGSELLGELDGQMAAVYASLGEAELAWSVAGRIGKWLEPATKPAGFDWRTDIALLAGVAAKEAVVSTMGTAWALGEQDPDDAEPLAERLKKDPGWSKATALALMLFVLLYSPCFVALVVIRQESGSWGWVAFSILFNTALAYGVAVVIYQVCLRLWA